jgi:hypothetical protein
MYSFNSNEMKDQIVMMFLDVMNETMSILKVEEATATVASSSTRRPKRRRCYVNHDHETTNIRL